MVGAKVGETLNEAKLRSRIEQLEQQLEKAQKAMKILAHYADHAVHCRSLQEFHNHPCNCGLEAALRGEEANEDS